LPKVLPFREFGFDDRVFGWERNYSLLSGDFLIHISPISDLFREQHERATGAAEKTTTSEELGMTEWG